MTLIDYQHVEIHQQEHIVLSDVNFQLNEGEFVYLIGKVGTGKTSLLKTFYGELGIIAGKALVLGYDMGAIKRKHINRYTYSWALYSRISNCSQTAPSTTI